MEVTRNAQVCMESDIGLKREQNEDTYLIVDLNTKDVDIQYYGTMYAVADGMGGHAGGEIASKMACQGLLEYYAENELTVQDTSDFYRARLRHLKTIIFNIHEKICKYSEQNTELRCILFPVERLFFQKTLVRSPETRRKLIRFIWMKLR
jgi:serine/threonine protein phosphatase PrpC